MFKKFQPKFRSKFTLAWLTLAILVVVILIVSQKGSNSPSLEQVLTQHQTQSGGVSMLVASLLAFSLLARSMAKSFEIYHRNKTAVCEVVLPEEDQFENISRLEGKLEEKGKEADELKEHNDQLRNTVERMISDIEKFKVAELMMRKSNISLGKECERLKFENEAQSLKINSAVVSVAKAAEMPKVIKAKVKVTAQKTEKGKSKVKK